MHLVSQDLSILNQRIFNQTDQFSLYYFILEILYLDPLQGVSMPASLKHREIPSKIVLILYI